MVAFQGGSESGPLEASARVVSLEDERVESFGRVAKRKNSKLPRCVSCPKAIDF
jgi:hypothetical protein